MQYQHNTIVAGGGGLKSIEQNAVTLCEGKGGLASHHLWWRTKVLDHALLPPPPYPLPGPKVTAICCISLSLLHGLAYNSAEYISMFLHQQNNVLWNGVRV